MDPDARQRLIAKARQTCRTLYEGVRTPHRSCGIALAETFGCRTPPYQALRRGGITGEGQCGAIVAGRLVLGELLGDPDPTAPVTPELRQAITAYEARWAARVDRRDAAGEDVVCNTLTSQFPIFGSPQRHAFCTDIATEVATAVAEVLVELGIAVEIPTLALD